MGVRVQRRDFLDPRATSVAGHNPLGAWNVIAILALLALQACLGLFAIDVDGIESGPLSTWVSFGTGRSAAMLHHAVFNDLLGLISLHLAALVFHRLYKGERLVVAMLTGMGHADRQPRARGRP